MRGFSLFGILVRILRITQRLNLTLSSWYSLDSSTLESLVLHELNRLLQLLTKILTLKIWIRLLIYAFFVFFIFQHFLRWVILNANKLRLILSALNSSSYALNILVKNYTSSSWFVIGINRNFASNYCAKLSQNVVEVLRGHVFGNLGHKNGSKLILWLGV